MSQLPPDFDEMIKRVHVAMQRTQSKIEEIGEAQEFIKHTVSIVLGAHHVEKAKYQEKIKKYESLLKEHGISFDDSPPNPA